MVSLSTFTDLVRGGWRTSPPLVAVGALALALLAASLAGVAVDPRTITGVPAWLKPAKFAASIAIYALTLTWVFFHLPAWTRTRRVIGWITAVVFVVELAIIDLQAWRGTTSHFNVGTPFDRTLFTIMGAAIVTQTLTSIAVAVALWRQAFDDRTLGWALRLGMSITIVGAFSGGLMTRPTGEQVADMRAPRLPAVVGAHTVGGPDGGPGLPVTGWSAGHGDLRVPHFVGLHALQALVLISVPLRRRRWPGRVAGRVMVTIGVSYGALFAILLWQALRGEPVIAPGPAVVTVLAAWSVLTAAGLWRCLGRGASGVSARISSRSLVS